MTVTKIGRAAGVSRSTVLYYESLGLLRPTRRTDANYRVYGERDLNRLRQIVGYRAAGLTLDDIRGILSRPDSDFAAILRRRLAALTGEVERLREHQRAIGRLLQTSDKLRKEKDMTKEKWVEIMRASGFSEADMHRWHAQFEKSAPEEHEEFLKYLHIPEAEVRTIREWSRKQAG
jgi:DNA-binding transcriptional MerR regulator